MIMNALMVWLIVGGVGSVELIAHRKFDRNQKFILSNSFKRLFLQEGGAGDVRGDNQFNLGPEIVRNT